MKDWASVILRLGLGIMFVIHGLSKAFGAFGGPGIDGFGNMLAGLNIHPASVLAYVVAYVELLGGACLIIGLLTRISSFLLIITMLIAVLKVHYVKGFFNSAGGYEYNLIIVTALIALMILGAGRVSISEKL